ncbi:hypothetical protein ACFOEQ_19215 [Chryseobacterium arachidis]|uniref:hypothetical protein n=1 Tax=Chryseobacterium arachidis TaxID=1416778 RepID=UPI00360CA54E
MSLNWDWTMNEKSKLNTVFYGSFGRGGGTNTTGTANGANMQSFRDNTTGLYNFDNIYAANQASTPDKGVLIRNASINSHNWFGVISSFNHKINDNMKFSAGVDARYYYGYHYQVVSDLLGGSGYIDKNNKNNPVNLVTATSKAEPTWNPFGGKLMIFLKESDIIMMVKYYGMVHLDNLNIQTIKFLLLFKGQFLIKDSKELITSL